MDVVHRPEDSNESLVITRDIFTSRRSWFWGTRVMGLFSVEGMTGELLTDATERITKTLDDINATKMLNKKKAGKRWYNWHQQIYKLSLQFDAPIRVSGTLVAVEPVGLFGKQR